MRKVSLIGSLWLAMVLILSFCVFGLVKAQGIDRPDTINGQPYQEYVDELSGQHIEELLVMANPGAMKIKILPSSFFYGLKTTYQGFIGLFMTKNKKAAYQAKLMNERLAEVYLVSKNDSKGVDKAIKAYISLAKAKSIRNVVKSDKNGAVSQKVMNSLIITSYMRKWSKTVAVSGLGLAVLETENIFN